MKINKDADGRFSRTSRQTTNDEYLVMVTAQNSDPKIQRKTNEGSVNLNANVSRWISPNTRFKILSPSLDMF